MNRELNFKVGHIIKVHQRISEGDKTRIQIFEGAVLSIRGRGENKMFTVRKLVGDIAVERIFPLNSPNIEKILIKGQIKQKVTRSKLYFLRHSLQ